jgi:cardiolipin synthase A/B
VGRLRVALIVVVLASSLPSAAAQLVIDGFATDLTGNEDAVSLRNLGATTVDLRDVEIADGNGVLGFPEGAQVPPNERATLTTNRSAYIEAFREEPDFALDAPDAANRLSKIARTFSLSNDGDAITIRHGEMVWDAVVYGHETARFDGWTGPSIETPSTMFLRWFPRRPTTDTDTAADWTLDRRAFAGEELFEATFWNATGTVIPYVAPEHSRSVVHNTLLSAGRSIRLNVYQFRDIALADDLAKHMRATPGLRVEVLLDASPVGESREERSDRGHVIETLVAAGADVHMFTHSRYAYDHAKYIVVDDEILLLQTENLVPTGIPASGRDGNRGWGLVIANRSVAAAAAAVFDADFGIKPFGARLAGEAEEPSFPPPALIDEPGSTVPQVRFEGTAPVTFMATPFPRVGDDPILRAIGDATQSIEVVQLDLAPRWRTPTGGYGPDVYLDALTAAAQRGVSVRILLDGHFLDDSASGDNADTVALLTDDFSGWPIEARLRPSSASVLHAKGMVVDGRLTLVGSMNWNSNSLLQNREVGVLVAEPSIAAFFRSVFERDWKDAGPDHIPGFDVVTIITLAGLAWVFKGTRRR